MKDLEKIVLDLQLKIKN